MRSPFGIAYGLLYESLPESWLVARGHRPMLQVLAAEAGQRREIHALQYGGGCHGELACQTGRTLVASLLGCDLSISVDNAAVLPLVDQSLEILSPRSGRITAHAVLECRDYLQRDSPSVCPPVAVKRHATCCQSVPGR